MYIYVCIGLLCRVQAVEVGAVGGGSMIDTEGCREGREESRKRLPYPYPTIYIYI